MLLRLRLNFLGTFRIELDGKLVQLPRRKTEALLAYLVLHPHAQARERLAAIFWGDTSAHAARRSLRVELSALCKILGDDLILADRDHAQINPAFPLWVDVRAAFDFRLPIAQSKT